MRLPSGRRQNASCDPCRRSKKRCAFDLDVWPGNGAACQNCAHLGHTCTFKFVEARQAQRRAKMTSVPRSVSSDLQHLPSSASELAPSDTPGSSGPIWAAMEPPIQQEICLDDMIWTGLGPNTFLDFDTFLNSDSQEWMDLSGSVSNAVVEETTVQNAAAPPSTSSLSPTTHMTEQLCHQLLPDESMSSGYWQGSPIRLLNSTALTHLTTKSLCHVYDTMMMGVARRYLSYNCNEFAGTQQYIIGPDYCVNQATTSGHENCQHLPDSTASAVTQYFQATRKQTSPQVSKKTLEPFGPITLIGVARFLDNFGTLYGNGLDQRTRKQDEETFMSVLQVFAMQFGPASDLRSGYSDMTIDPSNTERPGTMTQVYKTAWFNAHSYLSDSMDNRSFVHLYAAILFQMVAQPEEARSKAEYSRSPFSFLDRALYQLQSLSSLLKKFCSNLDSKSQYRTLLDSSRRVLFWFAYVRDTMSSFLSDRRCILGDAPLSIADTVSKPSASLSTSSLDENIPETAQKASRFVFSMFRQICRLNSLHQQDSQSYDQLAVTTSVKLLMNSVDTFHATHDDWMDQCQANFSRLSMQSKQFAGFLILYWNLGILRVVEVMKEASNVTRTPESLQMLEATAKYQQKAIQRFVAITKRINEASKGDFQLSDVLENNVPLILHHANTGLTVMALVKGIEHAIDTSVPMDSTFSKLKSPVSTGMPSSDLRKTLTPLLTCLSSLLYTISGEYTARPALQDLLQRYSDILLDCWSQDPTWV